VHHHTIIALHAEYTISGMACDRPANKSSEF